MTPDGVTCETVDGKMPTGISKIKAADFTVCPRYISGPHLVDPVAHPVRIARPSPAFARAALYV